MKTTRRRIILGLTILACLIAAMLIIVGIWTESDKALATAWVFGAPGVISLVLLGITAD